MYSKSLPLHAIGVLIISTTLAISVLLTGSMSVFAINDEQRLLSQSNGDCDPSSTCLNAAGQGSGIVPPGDNNVVRQSVDQVNGCRVSSQCTNLHPQNSLIEGDGNSLSQDSQGSNNCTSSECFNHVLHASDIRGNDNQANQRLQQNNICSDSGCENRLDIHFFMEGNNNEVNQQVDQENQCHLSSQCLNDGVLSRVIDNSGTETNQELIQSNSCVRNSVCDNTFTSSAIQSNQCVNDSSCHNSGDDNQTNCSNGATCSNSGSHTKVTSVGVPCTNGPSNTHVICQPGRTTTLPNP
jgi:hypothetical protein